MERSPSQKADSRLASQEIPLPLWNTKVHLHGHMTLSLNPILSQLNPVSILTAYKA